jgi:UDP-N-acetyl-2-amino-2-deoxyglucuronate dehydrogenase
MTDQSRPLGVGIVGAGEIMKRHALAYGALPGRARLVAVADVDRERAERARKAHGFEAAYEDPAAVLARDDVDVVSVCTRPNLHGAIVADALRAGKHVLCEKPIAATLAEADAVVAASERHPDLLVSFIYQWRFDPAVRMAQQLVESARLGRPLMAEAHVRAMRNDAYYVPAARRESWELDGGGVLIVVAIHQLDLLLGLLGEPLETSARMETFLKPTEGEDSLVAWIRFRNGTLATIETTICGQEDTFSIDVLGDKARVHLARRYPETRCRWEITTRDRARGAALQAFATRVAPAPRREMGPRTAGLLQRLARLRGRPWVAPTQWSHREPVTAFVDAVRAGAPAPMPPREARRSLELVAGIYHSALSGRVVRFPLDRAFPDYHGVHAGEVRAARGG